MKPRVLGVRLLGVLALGAGVTSVAVVAFPGQQSLFGGAFAHDQATVYGLGQAILAVALTLAAAGLVAAASAPDPRWRVALIGVVGLCSSQLAGVGLVAIRRWPSYWGCCSTAVRHHQLLRPAAGLMAALCAVTAVACLVGLVAWRSLGWQGWAAALAFPIAAVVAVAVPTMVVGPWRDQHDVIAGALCYSIPFAASLAVSGLMSRVPALVVCAGVAGSALVADAGSAFLATQLPLADARTLAVAAAVVTGLARLLPSRATAPGETSSATL